jgi:HTH-type transcriptional regulator/antitoxin HigA
MTASKTDLNPKVYRVLLGRTLPTVIHSEEQNQRYIEILAGLDSREELSPEERELAGLLTVLIENFEAEHYALNASTPVSMLQFLMDQHDLKQMDLLDVFGTDSAISQVLGGKREFSREHIRRLAKRFDVSPELFFAV